MSSYWVRRPRQNKYGNHKTKILFKGEEVTFDSKREAARAKELELLEKAGEIIGLEIQVPYELQPAFRDKRGKKIAAIKYVADFTYMTKDGDNIIEDVKSQATRNDKVYKLKRKMMAYQGYEITEVE